MAEPSHFVDTRMLHSGKRLLQTLSSLEDGNSFAACIQINQASMGHFPVILAGAALQTPLQLTPLYMKFTWIAWIADSIPERPLLRPLLICDNLCSLFLDWLLLAWIILRLVIHNCHIHVSSFISFISASYKRRRKNNV